MESVFILIFTACVVIYFVMQAVVKIVIFLRKKQNNTLSLEDSFQTVKKSKEEIDVVKNTGTISPMPKPQKMRYWLYDYRYDLSYESMKLYEKIVIQNLWIDEPFHSLFYEILLLVSKNDFMIFDRNSKVLTMNVRDKNNQVITSKSYQVFSTQSIIKSVLYDTIKKITTYDKRDAQNIVIAICILSLKKSLHYQTATKPQEVIDSLLRKYPFSSEIKYLISQIEEKQGGLVYVSIAFDYAYKSICTEPYNDSMVHQSLELVQKLPQKQLQEL